MQRRESRAGSHSLEGGGRDSPALPRPHGAGAGWGQPGAGSAAGAHPGPRGRAHLRPWSHPRGPAHRPQPRRSPRPAALQRRPGGAAARALGMLRPAARLPLCSARGGWAPGGSAARTSAGAGAGQPPRGCRRRHGAAPGLAMARSARQPPGGERRQVSRVSWAPGGWGAGGGEPCTAWWPSRPGAAAQLWGAGAGGSPRLGLRSGRRPCPRSGLQGRKMLRDPRAAVLGTPHPSSCLSPPTARSTVCTARAAEPAGLGGKGTSKPPRGLRRFRAARVTGPW